MILESLASGLVLVFAIAIGSACIISLYSPDRLMRFVQTEWDKPWAMYVAVVVRLILGAALIYAAPASRFPGVFTALGGIAIVAAIAIPVVGRERFGAVLDWFAERPPLFVRLWLLFGLHFCVFLVYGLL
ncbi:MAG: hypothetical protein HKN37_02990 [Rhodothermales bacterium]|nr:hypothetical protein [Rhodothermales bacterium]